MLRRIWQKLITLNHCRDIYGENSVITFGAQIYEIDPHKCTECVGHFDEPQCRQVCPVDCIPLDPNHVEDQATL